MITILQRETYLARLRGLSGTAMFRHLYADVDGETRDLAADGALSCALVVSSVLTLFGLLDGLRATVPSTVRALEAAGWVRCDAPVPGAVLVWEDVLGRDGKAHGHIGFSLGSDRAVSNDSVLGIPAEHHWTFGTTADGQPTRRVTAIFTHPMLDTRE